MSEIEGRAILSYVADAAHHPGEVSLPSEVCFWRGDAAKSAVSLLAWHLGKAGRPIAAEDKIVVTFEDGHAVARLEEAER